MGTSRRAPPTLCSRDTLGRELISSKQQAASSKQQACQSSRWSITLPITTFRSAWAEMPSKP